MLEDSVETVERLIEFCRKEFDAMLLDLPNTDERHVRKAVEHSNTLIVVMDGGAEAVKMEIRAGTPKTRTAWS